MSDQRSEVGSDLIYALKGLSAAAERHPKEIAMIYESLGRARGGGDWSLGAILKLIREAELEEELHRLLLGAIHESGHFARESGGTGEFIAVLELLILVLTLLIIVAEVI